MRKFAVLAVAVFAFALAAQPAMAHRMPERIAKKSAKNAGKELFSRTDLFPGATDYKVGKCKRRSDHRFDCGWALKGVHPENQIPYRCTAVLVIKTKTRTSYTVVAKVTKEKCEATGPAPTPPPAP
jgi:hypothetical protein